MVIAALISWFYFWTVDPEGDYQALSRDGRGYYNLLTQGFLKGQLSLDLPVDPFLATLKDPYDPAQRAGHGPHDASYFNGRYYIYFGVTPALLLFAPFHLATGWFIEEGFASLVFAVTGFWVSVAVMRRIRLRWFGSAPMWSNLAGVVALGLATMVPMLLRRPSIWEVPISCAYALFMATLYALLRASEGRNPYRWLVLASLAMGLCVGARPVYLCAAIVLLAPLGWLWHDRKNVRGRGWWTLIAALLVPITTVGIGLAIYNFLRFGNPLEFGQTYQIAGAHPGHLKLFSLDYLPYNARVYLLSPAGFTPYFPFFTEISSPPIPDGHTGLVDPYGMLPNAPWVALGLGALIFAVGRSPALDQLKARWLFLGIFSAGAATMMSHFGFCGVAGRYMVDFTPPFVLLGAIGALWLTGVGPPWWRVIGSALVAVSLAWSAIFGVLASLKHNDLLRVEHPVVYARVAQAGNRLAQWFAPVREGEIGPVELSVVFPRDAIGQVEPLVATGRGFRADYVYVNYLSEDTVRFGFEHTSQGGGLGRPVRIVPGVPHVVRVSMGSLYPPRAHPYFGALGPEEVRLRTRMLQVSLDGKIVLQRSAESYDATERDPAIGTSGARPGFRRDFSGQLIGWKRLRDASPEPAAVQTGPVRLHIRFPAFSRRMSEPLLSTGETGRGDLVYVTYQDERHVTFGHDHWGLGGAQSAPIEVDLSVDHTVEVRCPPLLGPGAPPGWSLRLDGREVLANLELFHPCEPDTIAVLANEIQASTSALLFSGDVRAVERVRP